MVRRWRLHVVPPLPCRGRLGRRFFYEPARYKTSTTAIAFRAPRLPKHGLDFGSEKRPQKHRSRPPELGRFSVPKTVPFLKLSKGILISTPRNHSKIGTESGSAFDPPGFGKRTCYWTPGSPPWARKTRLTEAALRSRVLGPTCKTTPRMPAPFLVPHSPQQPTRMQQDPRAESSPACQHHSWYPIP